VRRPAPLTVPVTLLFAYGTLMRGYALHGVLAGGATYLGPGQVAGTLLDLGAYPGLIEGRGMVAGEVYRIDAPELLPAVDREEGYNFRRRRRRIALTGDRQAWAWVYHYRGPRGRAPVIAHGDYRRAHPARPSGPPRGGRPPPAAAG
jgi:gamma-glutamylcyclotransferase (GGCT)/AIG2-like uncharacterized protein YtfP